MSSNTFFFLFIPILSLILLSVNFILAPHKPYKEKKTPFECGYHSFVGQNRTQFNIVFFTFGILFLLFDLEIILMFPFSLSSLVNGVFGVITLTVFSIVLGIGFLFEFGQEALKIDSKQYSTSNSDSIKDSIRVLHS